MRIAVTADLHYDASHHLTSPHKIAAMVEAIRNDKPDAVVIAGDLAHGLRSFRTCLALFRDLGVPVAVLAGNHDIWVDRHDGPSSADMWHTLLPGAVREVDAIWLEEDSLQLDKVMIVGSMVWYDYSAVDPGLSVSLDEIIAYKELVAGDARFVHWHYSDQEIAARLGEGLLQRLHEASTNPSVESILLVTHVPIFEQQMLRKPHDPQWGLTNAYFGNMTIGREVLAFARVRAVVSGHTHIGCQAIIHRTDAPPIRSYVVPSEYGSPAYIMIDMNPTEETP